MTTSTSTFATCTWHFLLSLFTCHFWDQQNFNHLYIMKLVSLAQFSCPEVDLPLPPTLPLYVQFVLHRICRKFHLMRSILSKLFNVAAGQEQKCTPMTGQPTGEWFLYGTWAPITSWRTDTILWIPEQACTHEAESSWSQLKLRQKWSKGLHRGDVQSYLKERMWLSGDVETGMLPWGISLQFPPWHTS